MAKTDYQSVDEYMASLPDRARVVLQTVRETIQAAVPEAEEVISYQIPAFKFDGWIFYFSAYKSHFSLSCPPPFSVFDAFKEDLARYELSKSTIKFPYDEQVPVKLIGDMAKYRVKENAERAAQKKKK